MEVSKEHRYILGNWKMAQSFEALKTFFKGWTYKPDAKTYAAVYPSFPHLLSAHELAHNLGVFVGGQDCSDQASGAFTGETACQQLKELGMDSVLIAHSERRQRFRESNEEILGKIEQAFDAELVPVFCVGESLKQREARQVESTLSEQLKVLSKVSKNVIIAYEPVWAIGTGKTASSEEIEETQSWIAKQFPESPVVYGGSVKATNAREILSLPSVNGVLVGGASLDAKSFGTIYETALSL